MLRYRYAVLYIVAGMIAFALAYVGTTVLLN